LENGFFWKTGFSGKRVFLGAKEKSEIFLENGFFCGLGFIMWIGCYYVV